MNVCVAYLAKKDIQEVLSYKNRRLSGDEKLQLLKDTEASFPYESGPCCTKRNWITLLFPQWLEFYGSGDCQTIRSYVIP